MYQKGLGRGIAETVAGGFGVVLSVGAFGFRTAACYAADKGLTCGDITGYIPVIAVTALAGSVYLIYKGVQHVTTKNEGDIEARRKLGDRIEKVATGNDNLATDSLKAYQAATELCQAGSSA